MDVRCEKCQTEYELDESRLKPGGVTVKCTNCGHMFKIRKRTPTNVGLPAVGGRQRVSSSQQPVVSQNEAPTVRAAMPRADSMIGDGTPSSVADGGSGPTERNWLVRLENGEQKTCRELATLQQWIVAGVATRESLISRSGKTWKRLGDITELAQYFTIADEARNQRATRPTPRPQNVSAAGGTVLPDDEAPTTTRRDRRPTPPPPPPQPAKAPDPRAATELAPTTNPNNNRPSTPPPAPAANRQTAAWANAEIKPTESIAAMPQGPRGGNFSAAAAKNEPMFAGRVRIEPGDESSFDTGRVKLDEDDPMIAPQRGSRAGMWIAVLSLLVIAGAAGAVYMFVFNNHEPVATAPKDAAAVAMAADAGGGSAVAPVADAGAAVAADPLDAARGELANGVEPRIKGLYDSLADKTDGPSLAMRARLGAALAQSELDRAVLDTDRSEADKLRKAGKQLAIEVAAIAQKALKAKSDDPYANLAMADVLRLQGKSAHDVDRYLQVAKTKAGDDKELAKAVALAAAQTDLRDSFYDDALKDLGPYTTADDPHVRTVLALIAFEQGKPTDARPFVDQVLAASPDHDVAHALAKRLETVVAKTDPMPAEDHDHGSHPNPPPNTNTANNGGGDLGGDYDALIAKAGKIAETNCPHAIELYQKALEQKPTGVEALTGIGYCYLDAKQFSSAFSKFHTALAVSQRYEPALAGVAETYQQQGNKDQAIASWRSYLDAFPGSPKAKKQLEILGADEPAPAPANNGAGSAQQPAPPTATPAPAPAPAPAATDGSASG